MKVKPIYVEIEIEREQETVWDYTQDPSMHVQWDLRFSAIHHEDKREDDTQTFTYNRHIPLLGGIEGWGKTKGNVQRDGIRTSSLHFGTDNSLSPIKEGSGYWKYEAIEEGKTKFLTQYNYHVPFGKVGNVLDYYIFRPLLGWGTALSFDVLRRWLERGENPLMQYRQFVIHWLVTVLFVLIWVYHGLVPKLLIQHPLEIQMITDVIPISYMQAKILMFVTGIGEIAFGVSFLLTRHRGKLFIIAILLLLALAMTAIVGIPTLMIEPFNPFTFNSSLIVLALIGYLTSTHLPSAKNCRRVKTRK